MRRLSSPHPLIHAPAAALWYAAERVLPRSVHSDPTLAGNMPPADIVPPTPIMQAHYFGHYCFLEPGQLLANADRLVSIPGVIVQGRYDLLVHPPQPMPFQRLGPEPDCVSLKGRGTACRSRESPRPSSGLLKNSPARREQEGADRGTRLGRRQAFSSGTAIALTVPIKVSAV